MAIPAEPKAPQPVKGKAPPADRTPKRPGDAEKITFDDLNLDMQEDVVYRRIMLRDRVKELDGQRVSIPGYMHGAQLSQRGITKFVLLKNTECKFGPGGKTDHLVQIFLKEGTKTDFTTSPVKVEGLQYLVDLQPRRGPHSVNSHISKRAHYLTPVRPLCAFQRPATARHCPVGTVYTPAVILSPATT